MVESLVDGEVRMGGSFRGSRSLKSSGNAGKIIILCIQCRVCNHFVVFN